MQSPLVTTAWLEKHLHDSNLRIIEIRGKVLPPTEPPPHYFSDRAGYEAAHIPGAAYIDWQVDIVDPLSPSNDVVAPDIFAKLMARLGIGNGTSVIIYDNAASMFACRMRWALRYYGHDDVRILDGGWDKWRAEARPVTAELPQFPPANFVPRINPALIATAADILAALETDALQLIDVRSPAEFSGAASRAQHGGHIPTAINLPRKTMVAADLTLRPAQELQSLFTETGIALDSPDTVIYCNSGVSATFGMLALEVAGARDLRIYDSSWKEWGNDDSTPKATAI